MKSNNKQNKSTTLIPIAMMFLAVGISMTTIWLKYSFVIISIILSAIALFLSLKNSNNNDK